MDIKKNVGCMDKKIRLGAGALLVLAGLLGNLGGFGLVLLVVGVVLIVSGLMKFCPAYTLLGINTCGGGSACGMGKKGCGGASKDAPKGDGPDAAA